MQLRRDGITRRDLFFCFVLVNTLIREREKKKGSAGNCLAIISEMGELFYGTGVRVGHDFQYHRTRPNVSHFCALKIRQSKVEGVKQCQSKL